MIRFLRVLAQILVLIIVALASALISMRLAIHGSEVAVPDFRGMAPAQAERAASARGLELALGDRFYSSTVAAGQIVSQQPEPGTHVRRGWRVQAAESLGAQQIEIPALLGLSPRAAEIDIRRRGLELGALAELPTPDAEPQSVIAQTPSPGAQGVASPSVSLLYAAAPPEPAYAMPDLTGLTVDEASALLAAAGLKVVSIANAAPPPPAPGDATPGAANPAIPGTGNPPASSFAGFNPRPPAVVTQWPLAGTRVTAGANVSFQVSRSL
jgi:beta-lactam-binding protein with PASTA domain